MLTEAILVIFTIVYYLFSTFLVATLVQDINKTYTILEILSMVLFILITAPIAAPIILGIEIGEYIKQQ